jgi:hypothetical protein
MIGELVVWPMSSVPKPHCALTLLGVIVTPVQITPEDNTMDCHLLGTPFKVNRCDSAVPLRRKVNSIRTHHLFSSLASMHRRCAAFRCMRLLGKAAAARANAVTSPNVRLLVWCSAADGAQWPLRVTLDIFDPAQPTSALVLYANAQSHSQGKQCESVLRRRKGQQTRGTSASFSPCRSAGFEHVAALPRTPQSFLLYPAKTSITDGVPKPAAAWAAHIGRVQRRARVLQCTAAAEAVPQGAACMQRRA